MKVEEQPPASEISANIEMNRSLLVMGIVPDEIQGAAKEELTASFVTYKVMIDWLKSKKWCLSTAEISEIESAIVFKIPNYKSVDFI